MSFLSTIRTKEGRRDILLKSRQSINTVLNFFSFSRIKQALLNFSASAAFFVTAIVFYELMTDTAIKIGPIQAPRELTSLGYTPELISKRVLDEIHRIKIKAKTAKQTDNLAPISKEVEVEIPGSKISLSYFAEIVGSFFGFYKQLIDGEITKHDEGYRIRIRIPSKSSVIHYNAKDWSAKSIDKLVKRSAIGIIEKLDPFILASYYYGVKNDEAALTYIKLTIDGGSRNEKAWAYNLLGVIAANKAGAASAASEANNNQKLLRPFFYFNRAIELKPDFAAPHMNSASAYLQEEVLEAAAKHFGSAEIIDPTLPHLHAVWAQFLLARDDPDAARPVIERGLKVKPGSTELKQLLAESYIRLGKLKKAILILSKLRQEDPINARTRFLLSGAYEYSGDIDAMQREKHVAESLDPCGLAKPDFLN